MSLAPDQLAVLGIRPQLLRLQLWHACRQVQRGERSLDFALRHWTGIGNFLAADAEQLAVVIRDLEAICQAGLVEDPDGFVERASAYLQPLLEQADARRVPARHSWYGCFRADLAADGVTTNLHFYNACSPRSPFADPAALRGDLAACITAICRQHPQIAMVRCASWINNLAPFHSLFPDAYRQSLVETDPDGKTGLGWWGQFITKENTLNPERVALLKETGRFQYPRLAGICSLASMDVE